MLKLKQGIAFGLFGWLICAFLYADTDSYSSNLQSHQRYRVDKVLDGDTLILEGGHHVRLLGINAPEMARKNKPGEVGGVEATRWLQRYEDHRLKIEFDSENRDAYGRFLTHLFDDRGRHINLALVRNGLAVASVIPPNTKYTEQLLAAQRSARLARKGLWGETAYKARPVEQILFKPGSGWQRLTATPRSIGKDRRFVRLVISDKIDIRIPRNNQQYFGDLTDYIGRAIEIRGWVSKREGYYSILVRHPSALVALE